MDDGVNFIVPNELYLTPNFKQLPSAGVQHTRLLYLNPQSFLPRMSERNHRYHYPTFNFAPVAMEIGTLDRPLTPKKNPNKGTIIAYRLHRGTKH